MTEQDNFFDKLEKMPPEEREVYLNKKLAEAIKHAYRHAPVVKETFDKAGDPFAYAYRTAINLALEWRRRQQIMGQPL